MFSGLRIEASPPFTVQEKRIYNFLKLRTSKFKFSFYVRNLVKINIKFFFQRLVVPGTIYRQHVPSEHYQFGQFISRACQNSQIERAHLSAKRAYQTRFLGRFVDQPHHHHHSPEPARCRRTTQSLRFLAFSQSSPITMPLSATSCLTQVFRGWPWGGCTRGWVSFQNIRRR